MLPRGSSRRSGGYGFHTKYWAFGKWFGWLIAGTFTFFVVVGFASWLQAKVAISPDSTMRGIASALPNEMFVELLGMEVTGIHRIDKTSTLSSSNVSHIVFEMLTGINPNDPRSVLAGEISGLGADKTILFRKGIATDRSVYPVDHTPSPDVLQPVPGSEPEDADDESGEPQDHGRTADPTDENAHDPDAAAVSGDSRERIRAFIYHSHNRESWVPELEGVTELNDAYDSEVNITLVGQRLAERLEEEGIGAKVSDKDYPSAIQSFNYNLSYSYSLKTVQEAAATYPDLQYYFDIHRDSQARDLTTATIDGTDYAQVYFVIGHKNPDWQKNEEFAQKIHDRLEDKYPGLSRGIYGKTAQTGNGEYNQHISPYAILIEVGGPENTLEESYRTIDLLAEVISEIFWDAEKVDAPIPGDVNKASVN